MALTGLEAAAQAAKAAGLDGGHAGRRGRRGPEEGHRLRPPGRRPLRRHQRVHQVDPRLATPTPRSSGWPGCSRPARTRATSPGGSIVHASEDIGHGRLARAPGGRGGRARGGARGAAGGAPEPGARHDLPGHRPEVEQRERRPRQGVRGRAVLRTGPAPPARRQLPGRAPARPRQGLPVSPRLPRPRVEQEYRPARFRGARYYEPSGMGEEPAEEPGEEPAHEPGRRHPPGKLPPPRPNTEEC